MKKITIPIIFLILLSSIVLARAPEPTYIKMDEQGECPRYSSNEGGRCVCDEGYRADNWEEQLRLEDHPIGDSCQMIFYCCHHGCPFENGGCQCENELKLGVYGHECVEYPECWDEYQTCMIEIIKKKEEDSSYAERVAKVNECIFEGECTKTQPLPMGKSCANSPYYEWTPNHEKCACQRKCNSKFEIPDCQFEHDMCTCEANPSTICPTVTGFSGERTYKNTGCPEGYVLEDGECLEECPEGYIAEGDNCVYVGEKSKKVTISPKEIKLFANGKDSKRITVKVVDEETGEPIEGEKIGMRLDDNYNKYTNLGRISSKKGTTGSDGTASFSYTAPEGYAGKNLKDYYVYVQAIHENGNPKSYVYLTDGTPKLSVTASKRVITDELEGESGVSHITLKIDDKDSSRWTYDINTKIENEWDGGYLATGQESKKVSRIKGKITETEFRFRWIRPDDIVIQRIADNTLAKDSLKAKKAYEDNLKTDIESEMLDMVNIPELSLAHGLEDFKGNVDASSKYLIEDYKRLESTTSTTGNILNMISAGIEGIQVYSGSKAFFEDAGGGGDDGIVDKIVGTIVGAGSAINHNIDKLQARIRYWADLEHEASLETIRVPVTITIKVTDDTGFTATERYMLSYNYHFDPKRHLERIHHPNAG